MVDDLAAEMRSLAQEIDEKAQLNDVKAATLITFVNRLHQWVGTLKSL